MRSAFRRIFLRRIFLDETGSIVSLELLLVATIVMVGMMSGLVTTRDAVISELSDVAGGLQDFNQNFELTGVEGHSASTSGSNFQDDFDFCDNSEDVAGLADNCIAFDGSPFDEEEETLSAAVLSEAGTFVFTDFSTGRGGSASGTIGDGTIDTGFTVTTDTGNISGTTANEVRFRENVANSGSFTITYDEPLTDFEFWIRNLANIDGSPENLLGNFKLTLSDGSVINNAAFTILPDMIAPNQSFGFFDTRANDNSLVSSVTRGGAQFVTDPIVNGTGDQASGRLVFPDIPTLSGSLFSDAIGLQSIMFDRSGGPNRFSANFSTSGRVIRTLGP